MSLPVVKVNDTLASFINEQTVIKNVVAHIKGLENNVLLKNDIKLVEYVLSLIVNSKGAPQKKEELKTLGMKILIQIFPDIQQEILSKSIDYLLDNKLVKKISSLEKFTFSFIKFFKKKVSA